MSDKSATYGRECRETIVKSGLTGVAATVLAVTVFSPAGFGGMIGTSLASGFGADSNAMNADDPYANLPAFPAPLSQIELENIRSELARTTASLEITRAATEARIEHIRSIALTEGVVTFAPVQSARVGEGLRLTTSEPDPFVAATPTIEVEPIRVLYAEETISAYRDPHLELADLLLAHETY
jgi:hypothetical protein